MEFGACEMTHVYLYRISVAMLDAGYDIWVLGTPRTFHPYHERLV